MDPMGVSFIGVLPDAACFYPCEPSILFLCGNREFLKPGKPGTRKPGKFLPGRTQYKTRNSWILHITGNSWGYQETAVLKPGKLFPEFQEFPAFPGCTKTRKPGIIIFLEFPGCTKTRKPGIIIFLEFPGYTKTRNYFFPGPGIFFPGIPWMH